MSFGKRNKSKESKTWHLFIFVCLPFLSFLKLIYSFLLLAWNNVFYLQAKRQVGPHLGRINFLAQGVGHFCFKIIGLGLVGFQRRSHSDAVKCE